MYNHVYQNYLENEVLVADPLKLVRLLYHGALDAVACARRCLEQADVAGRSRQISKAIAILNELALKLDHSKGGEVSRNLVELYDYMTRRLNEANFKQTDAPLAEVQALLTTLLEAWEQCSPAPAAERTSPYGGAQESNEEYSPISCTA